MVSTTGEETRGGCKGERTTHGTSGKTWDAWETQRRRRRGGAGAAVGALATKGETGTAACANETRGTRAHVGGGAGMRWRQHGPRAGPGRWAGAVEETTHWGHLIKRCAKETVATPAGGATGAARLSTSAEVGQAPRMGWRCLSIYDRAETGPHSHLCFGVLAMCPFC